MKKVFAICMTLVMVMSMSFTAFAEPGGFVSSPSGNSAPVLINYSVDGEDCTADIVITSYSDRDDLSDDVRVRFEKAYDAIVASDDLTDLNAELAAIAAGKNISANSLAVSDLFDISYLDCDSHDGHGDFDLTLKAGTLKNFVGLLYLNGDKWELVSDAKVEGNGEHLVFSSDAFAPYAIVVSTQDAVVGGTTGSDSNASQTGDILYAVISVMTISALAAVVLWRKSKRQGA